MTCFMSSYTPNNYIVTYQFWLNYDNSSIIKHEKINTTKGFHDKSEKKIIIKMLTKQLFTFLKAF